MKTNTIAVIDVKGQQFKVTEGASLFIDKQDLKAGNSVIFDQVLLLIQGQDVKVGKAVLPNVSVKGKVVGTVRGPKVIVFKKIRRKGFKKKMGYKPNTHISPLQIYSLHNLNYGT